jgi:hypothetical protein
MIDRNPWLPFPGKMYAMFNLMCPILYDAQMRVFLKRLALESVE